MIETAAEGLLSNKSLFIVDVKVSEGKATKISVILDGDQGVSISDCSELSRKLGAWMEENKGPEGAYTLEVTSPGLDTPLKTDRQYLKNIGRQVKVKSPNGNVLGELVSMNDEYIQLKIKKSKKEPTETKDIPRSEIESVVVQVSFK